MNNLNEIPIDELVLKRLRFHFDQKLGRDHQKFIRYEAHIDHIGDLIIHMERQFFGQEHKESHDVFFEEYDSWWEHFKDRFFPKKLLKRYPVKKIQIKKTVSFDIAKIFPDVSILNRDDLRVFHYMQTNLKMSDYEYL